METSKSKRYKLGAVPLIRKIMERIGPGEILAKYIDTHPNEKFHAVDSLLILATNLAIRKYPLYEVGKWLSEYDERGFRNYPGFPLSDDRLARALDKLFRADCASIMTDVVVVTIREFKICVDQIHNDSTTVKACGKYPGKSPSGFELKRGHSKDHRPDLKQLLYSLSVSADGFVPVHHKIYPGNVTDDTTHIETWNTIKDVVRRNDFIYVADCKVCTEKQLSHITENGGRVVTILPKTWKADREFRESLRSGKKISKKIIWRRKGVYSEYCEGGGEDDSKFEYYSLFSGTYGTEAGYAVHWIYSNRKADQDRKRRMEKIAKAERLVSGLLSKVNTRKLKEEGQVRSAIDKVLKKYSVQKFFVVSVGEETTTETRQSSPGRPGKKTTYRNVVKKKLAVSCKKNRKSIRDESHTDGIFPLLSTDPEIIPYDVLRAYKKQPGLEKRFSQFKSIHAAAPLFYKKVSRIEATMFLFFLSLLIQSLIEREVRTKMAEEGVEYLPIYPEGRGALSPTTSKIFDYFGTVGISKIEGKEFMDELGPTQKQILAFLGMSEENYWAT